MAVFGLRWLRCSMAAVFRMVQGVRRETTKIMDNAGLIQRFVGFQAMVGLKFCKYAAITKSPSKC